ncbi:hypothetical protein CDL15_Pgr011916 [Punica granatum]|uniref:Uncharacterized protein n=1 Tax=Punica granatum TaxID=22663 RepID=A0A218WDP9_PUNGR|nr:hypothetical protein CDL15_Pgr011916 [Punica granatum]
MIPDIKRVHRHEPEKDLDKESTGEKPEKGKGPFKGDKTHKGPKHHHEVAKEEKKKAMPATSSHGKPRVKAHHQFQAPAGSSTSSSSPSTGHEPSLQKGIKDDAMKLVEKLTDGHPTKHQLGLHPVHVITLAGENQGASMQLSSESLHRGEGYIHIHRDYKTNPDESVDPTTDEGEQVPALGEEEAIPSPEENPAPEAYINSNVQGFNNSIMFEGSVTERNPGVHVAMSMEEEAKLPQLPPELDEEKELLETRRSEFSPTPAERHTYQPIIRRRCLRGLLMESSDSDPDDPDKPRRHGCRYKCGAKGKDEDVNIL